MGMTETGPRWYAALDTIIDMQGVRMADAGANANLHVDGGRARAVVLRAGGALEALAHFGIQVSDAKAAAYVECLTGSGEIVLNGPITNPTVSVAYSSTPATPANRPLSV